MKDFKKEFEVLLHKMQTSNDEVLIAEAKSILEQIEDESDYEIWIPSMEELLAVVAITKYHIIPDLEIGTKNEKIKCMWCDVETDCTPLQVALYDFIMGACRLLENSPSTVKKLDLMEKHLKGEKYIPLYNKFHAALMYFRTHWSKEYMYLLD